MKPELPAIVLLSLLSTLSSRLVAQANQKPTTAPSPAAGEGAAPNPFAPDEAVTNLLGPGPVDPLAFQPLNDRPALPDMRLRGIVQLAKNPKPAALVELVGFGWYTVRAGESISFTVAGRAFSAPPAPSRAGADAAAPPPADTAKFLHLTSQERERAKEKGTLPAPGSAKTPTQVTAGKSTGIVMREQVPIVLRVERVAKDGVVVEIGTMGQYLIIR